jgi:hypothetical protein
MRRLKRIICKRNKEGYQRWNKTVSNDYSYPFLVLLRVEYIYTAATIPQIDITKNMIIEFTSGGTIYVELRELFV